MGQWVSVFNVETDTVVEGERESVKFTETLSKTVPELEEERD